MALIAGAAAAGCGPSQPVGSPAAKSATAPSTIARAGTGDIGGRDDRTGVPADLAAGPRRPADAQGPYPVVEVVDGDTIKVDRDGERTTVRLIGLDTPETVDPRKPVQCFGREASAHAAALLEGTSVWLTYDPTQGTLDRYDRTLAYVWLADGRLFNWVMIADGYGHEYTYDLPYEHLDAFDAAERDAREHERGLWSPATCGGDTNKPAGGRDQARSTRPR